MVTVLREGALRVVIYPDDHDPPHVHVMGDGETKILLGDSPEALFVISSIRTKANERRRAIDVVQANHSFLRLRWSELNG
jgi:hypothetical protein